MVCLGFKPAAAEWLMQTIPRSYGGSLEYKTWHTLISETSKVIRFKLKCIRSLLKKICKRSNFNLKSITGDVIRVE